MKLSKKTIRRIRKTLIFARGLFLALFGLSVFLMAAACSNEETCVPALIFFGIMVACFAISRFCDWMLNGGYNSPWSY